MKRRYLEAIVASGCIFVTCLLYKNGKNALDFYIASRLGELVGEGPDRKWSFELSGTTGMDDRIGQGTAGQRLPSSRGMGSVPTN